MEDTMTQQYEFKAAFPTKEEKDNVRHAIVEICLAVKFFSLGRGTVASPPQLLRFIVANAPGFIAWVQATRADAQAMKPGALEGIAAQEAAKETDG